MKIIIIIILMCFFIFAYSSSIYEEYIKCNTGALDSIYKGYIKENKTPPDSVIFFLSEISDNLLKSIALYRQIVDMGKNSIFFDISMYRLAKYYMLVNDSTNALNLLNRIIAIDTKYKPAAYNMLISYFKKKGDFKKTKEYINKLKTEFPDNYYALLYDEIENLHAGTIEKYYTVQIAAFKNKENAIKMINNLNKKSYKAELYYNKGLYKVIVGKFNNKTDALNYSKIIQKAEGVSVWVIKVE